MSSVSYATLASVVPPKTPAAIPAAPGKAPAGTPGAPSAGPSVERKAAASAAGSGTSATRSPNAAVPPAPSSRTSSARTAQTARTAPLSAANLRSVAGSEAASSVTPADSVSQLGLALGPSPKDVQAYLAATTSLRTQGKWGRKIMPMVMQSAGFGLMVATVVASHMPMLLVLAPALIFCGGLLAAPAGWVMAKFLQLRLKDKVEAELGELTRLRQQPDFAAIQAAAVDQLAEEAQQAAAAQGSPLTPAQLATTKARLLDKLSRAESFARGEGLWDTGIKRFKTSAIDYWKPRFNEAVGLMETAWQGRRAKAAAAKAAVEAPVAAAAQEAEVADDVAASQAGSTKTAAWVRDQSKLSGASVDADPFADVHAVDAASVNGDAASVQGDAVALRQAKQAAQQQEATVAGGKPTASEVGRAQAAQNA